MMILIREGISRSVRMTLIYPYKVSLIAVEYAKTLPLSHHMNFPY